MKAVFPQMIVCFFSLSLSLQLSPFSLPLALSFLWGHRPQGHEADRVSVDQIILWVILCQQKKS